MGSQLLEPWTTWYFLLYQDCHLFQHRDQRISKIISRNWDYYQIQSRLEVSSMHAGKPMLTDPDKQATGNREQANKKCLDEMYISYSPSQLI